MSFRPYTKREQLHKNVLEVKSIQAYKDKPTAWLKKKAQDVFNAWIRKRDDGKPCISCGKYTTLQAGHFYSAGHHNNLRFHENNCAGQCVRCNYHLHGNLTSYREGLIKRIGLEAVEELDLLSGVESTKNDRFLFIDIIERYK